MGVSGKQWTSIEEVHEEIDKMAEELKGYVNENAFLWADDIGEIIDRHLRLGTIMQDALALYSQAKWILIDRDEDSD